MFTVTVSHNTLRALALIAPKDDVRIYLNGLLIDTTTPGRVMLVACDGHRALVVGNAKAGGDIDSHLSRGQFIVPIEAITSAKPVRKDPIEIQIDPITDIRADYTVRGKLTGTGRTIDGRFPDWRRIIPTLRTGQGELAHFNLQYLGDFGRAAELLDCKYPHIVHNGECAAWINLGSDAFGILMPIRGDTVVGCGGIVTWLDAVAPEYVTKKAA
ncbi:MAG TPA: hypothetical protein VFB63_19590 [Bryobacteraceae bacterium]|nr:hypothetical protein [Bryobacteraceae bacterium]